MDHIEVRLEALSQSIHELKSVQSEMRHQHLVVLGDLADLLHDFSEASRNRHLASAEDDDV